jgi:hypothetical protein
LDRAHSTGVESTSQTSSQQMSFRSVSTPMSQSQVSLDARCYHANPTSHFSGLLPDSGPTPGLLRRENYEELLEHRIGLTDMNKYGERERTMRGWKLTRGWKNWCTGTGLGASLLTARASRNAMRNGPRL